MCGQFVMSGSMEEYIQDLDTQGELFAKVDSKPIARYYVAPGTDVQVMHVEAEGVLISPIHWGWKREISWPKPRIVQPINARIETIARGRFYKPLFPDQAHVLRWAGSGRATLGSRPAGRFLIITGSSDAGILDIYERRPVMLSPSWPSNGLRLI